MSRNTKLEHQHSNTGTFIVNFLIKPALKKIEANRARKPTRDQTRNRKKVLAVLYRIIANRRYEKDKQPWMRPINQLIANKQKECWTMIQNVCTFVLLSTHILPHCAIK